MRYTYLKNGDAVDQVRRISATGAFDPGGPDAFIGNFLAAHRNDEILVLCTGQKRNELRAGKVTARVYRGHRRYGSGIFGRMFAAARIGLAIIRSRPDRVLCGCTGEMLWACVMAAKLLRVPIVNSRHGEVQRRSGIRWLTFALDRACIRRCDGVACHGPYTLKQILQLGVPPSRVFEFEVDLRAFAETPAKAQAPEVFRHFVRAHTYVFTFIGRLHCEKGVFDLLEAFCKLRAKGVAAGLVYVGGGLEEASLRQDIRRRGVADEVLLLGNLPHEHLPAVIRHSSIVVTPTRPEFPEGRCMAALEALVLGVPVVAPRFGPFPHVIDDGVNGLLYEPANTEALAAALERVSRSDALASTLREGAAASSKELLAPRLRFSEAVAAGFAVPRR